MTARAKTLTLPTRADWLEARRGGLGASDAPVLLGLSKWKSPLQLYTEKLGIVEPDVDEREALVWGLKLEPVLLTHYGEVTDRKVNRPAPFAISLSALHPWMMFSPDGYVEDERKGPGVVQVKTASAYRLGDWEDEPPLAYQVQLQHEMAVADVVWGSLAVLIGGQHFRYYDIARNDRFVEELIRHEEVFWRRLRDQDPPDIDGSPASTDLLKKLYPQHADGLVVNLPGDATDWDAQLEEAKAVMRAAEGRKAEAENRLKSLIGEAEAGVLPNGITYSWKTSARKGYVVEPSTVRSLRRKDARA